MPRVSREDLDYASLDVPWSGDEEVQRTVKVRWAATVVYLIAVTLGALMPLFWPGIDEGAFVTVYVVTVVVGAMLLVFIIFKPLVRPPGGEVKVKHGLAEEDGVTRRLRPGETYYLRIRFDLILYIMLPVILFMAVLMVFIADRTTVMIIGVTTAGITAIMLVFLNFEVKADMEVLSFKFGPFGKVLPLDGITSIGVTQVNAMRDYMGYGVRVGPDGSIGYILRGGGGFRVETGDGKRYVVTIPEPEGLVEYVLAAKAERERR